MEVRIRGAKVCFPDARTNPFSSGDACAALPRDVSRKAGVTGVACACLSGTCGTGILDLNSGFRCCSTCCCAGGDSCCWWTAHSPWAGVATWLTSGCWFAAAVAARVNCWSPFCTLFCTVLVYVRCWPGSDVRLGQSPGHNFGLLRLIFTI